MIFEFNVQELREAVVQINPREYSEDERYLLFVKDHGVYICVPKEFAEDNKVVYASGHNPNEGDEAYIGGDDWGEEIQLTNALMAQILCAERFLIDLRADYYEIKVDIDPDREFALRKKASEVKRLIKDEGLTTEEAIIKVAAQRTH